MPLGAHKAAIMGVAGVSTGDVVLIYDTDHSNAASASISSGIDSTYGEYIFGFYNMNPATDDAVFTFQVNATDDAGGDYDVSLITTTNFYNYHWEADDAANVGYLPSEDQAQSANFVYLQDALGNDADASCAGTLHLFNPSSTTYVKHFLWRGNAYRRNNGTVSNHVAGYINDTTAIDDIQFKMSTGNFDGTIKMWGGK